MTDDSPQSNGPSFFGLRQDRVELLSTVVLAIAAILTAWSAFQSAKWSGVQAVHFAQASAARTESVRFDNRAGQLVGIDVAVFVDWLSAVDADLKAGSIPDFGETGSYSPTDGTLSGFLFTRMRAEFKPALDAWLASKPLVTPDAPKTPFEMSEYALADAATANEYATKADEATQLAQTDNQTSDNYVLTAVMFATVLFFAGVSSKLSKPRNRYITLSLGILILIAAAVTVFSYPIEI